MTSQVIYQLFNNFGLINFICTFNWVRIVPAASDRGKLMQKHAHKIGLEEV